MKKITIGISGMTCSACSNGLEKYLNRQEGILSANVNLVMANATIEYDEHILDLPQIDKFVKNAGFKSLGKFDLNKEERKNKVSKINLIVFGCLLVILMCFSMLQMVVKFPEPFNMHKNALIFSIILFVLVLPFLIYGFEIIINGFKNLFHLTPNMDTLVCLGVLSCLFYSIFCFVMIAIGKHEYVEDLYLESVATIIYFIKLGRFIDGINKRKTKEAIKDLVSITPNTARIKTKEGGKIISIDEVKKGDILCCYMGEKVAVDGVITKGNSHIDESFITGESKSKSKSAGDNVIAGSFCFDGYIEYRAERIGKDSTISEVVNMVVQATNTKMPIAKLSDKISGVFVPIVFGVALISLIVYLIIGFAFTYALNIFVSVLVIACPCALGLATPLAVIISEGMTAKNGILVKNSESFEIGNKIDTIVFDKTGTLTCGRLKVSEIKNYSSISENEILSLICSIEQYSTHPISNAFKEIKESENIEIKNVEDFNNLAGYGLFGIIDNKVILAGNEKLLKKYKIKNKYKEEENVLQSHGNSIVYLVYDKEIIALFGVKDKVRDDAVEVIKNLKENGYNVIMLTGDNEKTAKVVASELGIDEVIANVLPSEKANVINNLKKSGKRVLMCGDGVNDSPALALADIGVSVYGGTDIAQNTADIIFMEDNLQKVITFLDVSKRTLKNIKQNLFWAFFYNVLMIPIAVGVFSPLGFVINPMIASLAMVLSSLTITLNALRLKIKRR